MRIAAAPLDIIRPLRLRALQTDPGAFGSSYEREVDRPDEDWRFWVDDSLVAFIGDEPAGMVNVKADGQIFGMWVAPEHRGKGVGEALLAAALKRIDGDARLCVMETSPVAKALYEKAGFRETSRCEGQINLVRSR